MKRHPFLLVAIGLLVLGALLIGTNRSSNNPPTRVDPATSGATPPPALGNFANTPPDELKARVATAYARLPLHFEANQGQTDAQVKFLTRGIGHTLFLTESEAVLVLTKSDPTQKTTRESPAQITQIVLRMKFVDANPRSRVVGLEELPGKANYFVGSDSKKWHTNVPLYTKVRYHDLYPGIDLNYSGDQGTLKSDFVVRPGATPHRIVLAWEGADSVDVDGNGELVLHTAGGVLRHRRPDVYQEMDGARRRIAGRYVLKDPHQVGFEIAAYDAARSLVIGGSAPFSITTMR
jgi:hypothetical protein